MPLFFSNRATGLTELMDNTNCDQNKLFNTYRYFATVNSLISRWKSIYRSHIAPLALKNSRSITLLDIGFGGGDIPIALSKWAAKDDIELAITAIETDPRALEFTGQLATPNKVNFELISAQEMLAQHRSFDIVISNHLLHHIPTTNLPELLETSRKLSRKRVIFNDIERSDIGWLLFNLLSRPFFRNSYVTQDGLTSIRRSYTRKELQAAIPDNWQVKRLFPFRLLLTFTHE